MTSRYIHSLPWAKDGVHPYDGIYEHFRRKVAGLERRPTIRGEGDTAQSDGEPAQQHRVSG